MSAKSFLDTNVFVYDIDTGAPREKRAIAHELIRDALRHGQSVISYQVVQEFLNVATRKFTAAMSASDAAQYVQAVFQPLLAIQSSIELFHEALDIGGRHRLSWYDSLILAAAFRAKCEILYSEDMSHGAKVNGVRVENPFRRVSS